MSDEDCFGPALPPGFNERSTYKNLQKETPVKSVSGIGPQLPPHLQNSQESSPDSTTEEEEGPCIGPSLPPHFKSSFNQTQGLVNEDIGPSRTLQSKSDDNYSVIGPALPPHLSKKQCQSSDVKDNESDACVSKGQSSKQDSIIGPSLPPHLQRNVHSASYGENVHDVKDDDDDDDADNDVIGPLPSEMSAGNSGTDFSAEFERRARKMKDHLDGKTQSDGQQKREAWMMELPDCMGQNIGLTARTFRVNAGPDLSDRSMWTDSPADRARKEKEGHEETRKRPHPGSGPSGRDQQIRSELESFNKARESESLLNMHQKKMKKQQKEEGSKPKERRPFDRDLDLQANRFDDAQRKAIIKKSQNLNSRFGHSKDSQYL